MGLCFGPKCFLASSFFILTILSIYGIVGAFLNYQKVEKMNTFGDWPFNLRPLFYAYIIIQALFPVAGLMGLAAGCKNQPMLLYGSGSVLLGIFTCCCVFGSVSLNLSSQEIMDEFYSAVKKNIKNDTKLADWMNDTQWQNKCCGVYSFVDWSQFGGNGNVPWSCCRRDYIVPGEGCGNDILLKASSLHFDADKFIYTTGCGKKISSVIQSTSRRLSYEILMAAGMAFLVAIFLYTFVTLFYVRNDKMLGNPMEVPGNGSNNDSQSSNGTATSSSISGVNSRNVDANNNSYTLRRTGFSYRDKQRGIEKRRNRTKGRGSKNRSLFTSGSHSQTKFARPISNNEINGNICASKSFILGEAQSNLINMLEGKDQDILRKNVDMLWYQSLDKNMSTLSTTPTDISCMTFPSILQSKRHMFGSDLLAVLNEEEQRNTVYTLVSERPFTPSLSQNCSVSIFNGNQGKILNGMGEVMLSPPGQNSPHFITTKPRQALQVAEEEQAEEIEVEAAQPNVILTPLCATPPQNGIESPEKEDNLEENSNESLVNVNVTAQPLTNAGAKFTNLTSTVRSSTLGTIQEESESTKGSPAPTKVASPASGYMSPESGVTPQQTETDLHKEPDKNAGTHSKSDDTQIDNASGDNECLENVSIRTKFTGGFEIESGNENSEENESSISKNSHNSPDLNQNQRPPKPCL